MNFEDWKCKENLWDEIKSKGTHIILMEAMKWQFLKAVKAKTIVLIWWKQGQSILGKQRTFNLMKSFKLNLGKYWKINLRKKINLIYKSM